MKFELNPKPFFIKPEILCDPILPPGLHRVNPRSIKGKAWWDIVREEAYKKNNWCCWACGIHTSEAVIRFGLDAHERFEYRYGYRSGKAYLKEVCALCYACHNFVHIGRLKVIAKKGIVAPEVYRTVLAHGIRLLEKYDLQQKTHPARIERYRWPGWTLEFEGQKYKSPFKSFEQYLDFFSRTDSPKE